jgi:hypothetical protein
MNQNSYLLSVKIQQCCPEPLCARGEMIRYGEARQR